MHEVFISKQSSLFLRVFHSLFFSDWLNLKIQKNTASETFFAILYLSKGIRGFRSYYTSIASSEWGLTNVANIFSNNKC